MSFSLESLLRAADPPETAFPSLSEEARNAAAKGLADFRNDKFEDAKSEFQKMAELAPTHPMAWANLWLCGNFPWSDSPAEEH